jgi:hypothetical protein
MSGRPLVVLAHIQQEHPGRQVSRQHFRHSVGLVHVGLLNRAPIRSQLITGCLATVLAGWSADQVVPGTPLSDLASMVGLRYPPRP